MSPPSHIAMAGRNLAHLHKFVVRDIIVIMTQDNYLSEHKKLNERLTQLEVLMGKIAEKILGNEFYGGETWWKKEISVALKEYKKGLGKVISNKKELKAYFDQLEESNGN